MAGAAEAGGAADGVTEATVIGAATEIAAAMRVVESTQDAAVMLGARLTAAAIAAELPAEPALMAAVLVASPLRGVDSAAGAPAAASMVEADSTVVEAPTAVAAAGTAAADTGKTCCLF